MGTHKFVLTCRPTAGLEGCLRRDVGGGRQHRDCDAAMASAPDDSAGESLVGVGAGRLGRSRQRFGRSR